MNGKYQWNCDNLLPWTAFTWGGTAEISVFINDFVCILGLLLNDFQAIELEMRMWFVIFPFWNS